MNVILLFDMDGVLLEPRGYHKALQDTVRTIGESIGFKHAHLSQEDIYAFEAAGVTSEWDSSAICLGLMMKDIWQINPQAALPETINPIQDGRGSLPQPDWGAFLDRLNQSMKVQATPVERAARILKEDLSQGKRTMIDELMSGAHDAKQSITHRTFQEFVLGSDTFQEVYRLKPQIHCGSYLERYDRPTLPPQAVNQLKGWNNEAGHSAAILTNRPSRPPDETFGTPEAEIGAALVGLDRLPVVGYGQMSWIANVQGRHVDRFRKPSPVHALAACLAAINMPIKKALRASSSLVFAQKESTTWNALQGSQVIIFEDTPTGIQSLIKAKENLSKIGVELEITAAGISKDPQKQQALAERDAILYPDLAQALKSQLDPF